MDTLYLYLAVGSFLTYHLNMGLVWFGLTRNDYPLAAVNFMGGLLMLVIFGNAIRRR